MDENHYLTHPQSLLERLI